MTKEQINEEAIKYCSHIDFTSDDCLNEKGRKRITEWCKQDFIAGATYVQKQLILSCVIKSVCLDGNTPINCNLLLALGNCNKCIYFNNQMDVNLK